MHPWLAVHGGCGCRADVACLQAEKTQQSNRLAHSRPSAACSWQAPQNVVNISIPTVFDPSLAPPGKHLIHAYTGALQRGRGLPPFADACPVLGI